MGNGRRVCIGNDPWPGCNFSHILPRDLVGALEQNNYFFLEQVWDKETTSIFHQGWKLGAQ